MQAGLLRDKIIFYAISKTQNEYGEVEKGEVEVLSTKCYRRKLNTNGMGVNAIEEFIAGTIVVQVRNNSLIVDGQKFQYGIYKYKISLIDKQLDNTLIITGTKLNEKEV